MKQDIYTGELSFTYIKSW